MMNKMGFFKNMMKRLKDNKDNLEERGVGADAKEEMAKDKDQVTTPGAQLDNGMRPMRVVKDKTPSDDMEEGSDEEEASESPEEAALEDDESGLRPSAGKHLFPKGHGLQIMISLANARKGKR